MLIAIVAVCGVVLYHEHLGICFWLMVAALACLIALVTVGAGKLYLVWSAKRLPQKRPNTGLFVFLICAISLLSNWNVRLLHLSHRVSLTISILFGVVMFSLIGVMFARIMHWQRATKANCAH